MLSSRIQSVDPTNPPSSVLGRAVYPPYELGRDSPFEQLSLAQIHYLWLYRAPERTRIASYIRDRYNFPSRDLFFSLLYAVAPDGTVVEVPTVNEDGYQMPNPISQQFFDLLHDRIFMIDEDHAPIPNPGALLWWEEEEFGEQDGYERLRRLFTCWSINSNMVLDEEWLNNLEPVPVPTSRLFEPDDVDPAAARWFALLPSVPSAAMIEYLPRDGWSAEFGRRLFTEDLTMTVSMRLLSMALELHAEGGDVETVLLELDTLTHNHLVVDGYPRSDLLGVYGDFAAFFPVGAGGRNPESAEYHANYSIAYERMVEHFEGFFNKMRQYVARQEQLTGDSFMLRFDALTEAFFDRLDTIFDE